ncbi:MAG: MoaD/ThiS family protein [Gammaproteobacteria bacterium]
MQVTLLIPAALRMHSGGADQLAVDAGTLRKALHAVRREHAALAQHLLTRDGELRPFVKAFVHSSDVRDLDGLDTMLNDGDTVAFVASVAGG